MLLMRRLWLRCGQLTFLSFYVLFFAAKGYEGFAAWMKAQSREENDHADMLAQYVFKRGGVAKVGAIDTVPQEWESPLAVFEHVYKHECHVSEFD